MAKAVIVEIRFTIRSDRNLDCSDINYTPSRANCDLIELSLFFAQAKSECGSQSFSHEMNCRNPLLSRFFGAFNKIEICLTCLALLKWSKYAFNGISADILPSPRDETIWPFSSVPSLPLFRSLARTLGDPSLLFVPHVTIVASLGTAT